MSNPRIPSTAALRATRACPVHHIGVRRKRKVPIRATCSPSDPIVKRWAARERIRIGGVY